MSPTALNGNLAFSASGSCSGTSVSTPRPCPIRLPAKLREGTGSSTPYVRVAVFERGAEGLGGTRITDLAESCRSSSAHAPARVFEADDQGLESTRVTDLAERVGGSVADIHRRASESGLEGLDRAWVADLAKGFGSCSTHARAVVSESGDEWLDGVGVAYFAQSLGGVPAHTPELLILQRLDQPERNLPWPSAYRRLAVRTGAMSYPPPVSLTRPGCARSGTQAAREVG